MIENSISFSFEHVTEAFNLERSKKWAQSDTNKTTACGSKWAILNRVVKCERVTKKRTRMTSPIDVITSNKNVKLNFADERIVIPCSSLHFVDKIDAVAYTESSLSHG